MEELGRIKDEMMPSVGGAWASGYGPDGEAV